MIVSLYSPTQQSGKSTVANYLVEEYGFARIKFASPIYEMAYALALCIFDTSDKPDDVAFDTVYGDNKDVIWPILGVSTRDILRTLGTEWGRDTISKSLWADIAMQTINSYYGDVVFDDHRFPEETDKLRDANAIFVRIIRPDAFVDRSHPSEGLLDDLQFDYTIVNDGSIDDLLMKVEKMLEQLQ